MRWKFCRCLVMPCAEIALRSLREALSSESPLWDLLAFCCLTAAFLTAALLELATELALLACAAGATANARTAPANAARLRTDIEGPSPGSVLEGGRSPAPRGVPTWPPRLRAIVASHYRT